jgi:hypothetical protein
MFRLVGQHVPPPPMPSPVLWGEEETVGERLGHGVSDLRLTRRQYPFRYPFPPAQVVEWFLSQYGPTNRAYAALDPAGQERLRREFEELWTAYNQATDGSTAVDSEYLEVIGTRM